MNIYTIYKFTNKINNKCYIGKTTNIKRRLREHENSIYGNNNNIFYNAIRKYGFDQFIFDIVFQSTSKLISEKEFTNFFEPLFIEENKSHYTQNGYNTTWGGDGFDSETNRKTQENLVKQNRHNFQKRPDGTSLSLDRTRNGTNNFLTRPDGTNVNTDRVMNGTHHLLKENGGSEKATLYNIKRLEEGSHLFLNPEFQSKISRETKIKKTSRESVTLLRKYAKIYKLKLGSGWYLKSDEWVEEKLNFYIKKLGSLD
jgi:group I intron endonuclease